ncbi:hypothetical protein ABPG75_010399 [Micractinium tetrahymenae]
MTLGAAALKPAALAPAWEDLPEAALSNVFSHLQWDRLPTVALVCKRWHDIALRSPHCLTSLGALVGAEQAEHTHHIMDWLARYAAPRVQKMHLRVRLNAVGGDVLPALQRFLDACGMAGKLASVKLEGPLVLAAQLGGLAALTNCQLFGRGLQLSPAAQLPVSLTSLQLEGMEPGLPPAQLATLTNLHTLSLGLPAAPAGSFTFLTALTSLTSLQLSDCEVPACLPRLTQLASLGLGRTLVPDVAGPVPTWHAMQGALQPLTQLRSLMLAGLPGLHVPPVLTRHVLLGELMWRRGV